MGNGTLNQWYIRALLVAAGTYLAWKYLPGDPWAKTVTLAIGGVATAGVIAGGIPAVGQLLNGNVAALLPAQQTTA